MTNSPGYCRGLPESSPCTRPASLALGNRFSDNGIASQLFPVGSAAQAQSLVEFAFHIADHRNTVKAVLERADVGGIGLYAYYQIKAGVFQGAVLPDQIAQLILGEGAAEEPVQCQNQRAAASRS